MPGSLHALAAAARFVENGKLLRKPNKCCYSCSIDYFLNRFNIWQHYSSLDEEYALVIVNTQIEGDLPTETRQLWTTDLLPYETGF